MDASPAWVYLPDDEPDDTLGFGGTRYTLQPNVATKIVPFTQDLAFRKAILEAGHLMAPPGVPPAALAAHFTQTHGRWGVALVHGPVKDGKASSPTDQQIVDAAETLYMENTRKWAEDLVLERAARDKPRIEVGLRPSVPTKDEVRAEEWLRAKHLIK